MLLAGYSTAWPTALMAVGGAWQDAGLNSNKIRISHPGLIQKYVTRIIACTLRFASDINSRDRPKAREGKS